MYLKIEQETFDAQKNNLILDSNFKDVLNFLIFREDTMTTLRDIKRAFPEIETFDRYIDDLVANNLLNRYHGRYTFSGEFISKNSQIKVNERVVSLLNQQTSNFKNLLKQELSKEESLAILYFLFKDTQIDEISVYEESLCSHKWFLLPSRYTEFQGKKAKFFSMGTRDTFYGNNIPDYFNFLTLNQINLPKKFLELRDKLGDVNLTYFIHYCERKLRRLERGKVVSVEKPDIFMDALSIMNYATVADGKYHFNVIRLSENAELSPMLNELLQQLMLSVDDFPLQQAELLFMTKCILVSWLLDENMINFPKTLHGML